MAQHFIFASKVEVPSIIKTAGIYGILGQQAHPRIIMIGSESIEIAEYHSHTESILSN